MRRSVMTAFVLAWALILAGCAASSQNGLGHGSPGPRVLRMAVVPFKNVSGTPGAGAVVSYLFINEIATSGAFEVIEPGEVRRVLIAQRSMGGGMDAETASALREELGADLILGGVVETHRPENGLASPAASAVSVSLMATRGTRLIWGGEGYLSGDQTAWVLNIGRLHTPDSLAQRIAANLTRRMEEVVSERKDKVL